MLNVRFDGIERSLKLDDLRRCHLDSLKSHWMGGKTNGRTAVNYLKTFKGMLDWAYGNEISSGHEKPKGYDKVFRFRKYKHPYIRPYRHDELKELLAAASEPVQLNILLGLNCGMYGVDIGELELAEVRIDKGYICWSRSKTQDKNHFRTCHRLWPETAALLKRHVAELTSNATKS